MFGPIPPEDHETIEAGIAAAKEHPEAQDLIEGFRPIIVKQRLAG
jgi:hypothetical protein